MPTGVNQGFKNSSPFSLDDKYLKNGSAPYTDIADVNGTIQQAYRHRGLTVLIGKKEHWYRDGITNNDLIQKNNDDVLVLNSVDGSYPFLAGDTITGFFVSSTVHLPSFLIGKTDNGGEIVPSADIPANSSEGFAFLMRADVNGNIFFNGVAGSGGICTINILKR